MNQNNNKNNQNGKGSNNGNNWRGLLSLVSWALLLTIVISYAGTYMNSTSQDSSSVEIKYSEFSLLVKEDKVVQCEVRRHQRSGGRHSCQGIYLYGRKWETYDGIYSFHR